ncbi:MAG: DnaA/Hda family protein, partial [Thermofilaceae archaeon]
MEFFTPEVADLVKRVLKVEEVSVQVVEVPPEAEVEVPGDGEFVYGGGLLSVDYVLENYYVGTFNRMAYQAVLAALERRPQVSVACVYAGTGLGKSHLLQGAARKAVSGGMKVAFFTGEAFVEEVFWRFKKGTVAQLYERIAQAQALVIDDLQQAAAAPESVHAVLFEVLNTAMRKGAAVITSCDVDPGMLLFHERIRSRLTAGPCVAISLPGFKDRRELLRVIARRREVELPEEFVETAAALVPGCSIRTLELVVSTFSLYTETLRDLPPDKVGQIIIADLKFRFQKPPLAERAASIKEYLLAVFDMSEKEFASGKTPRHLLARRAAVYAAVSAGMSLGEAARILGLKKSTAAAVYAAAKETLAREPNGELA